ncbi:hypothetical protein D8674_020904 [Pyrus ussuriensis x Pyrus communis]|uniref:Uncharacterized protein n=1 Tax=Pyrus ussuriensis x Pyrus communis TaxID=2448454 RepID=A0A5N5HGZ9_9ROSA|nr:hypothetical protein D8674_020904 [Pyrus ussuriensis x Pyrus communis]
MISQKGFSAVVVSLFSSVDIKSIIRTRKALDRPLLDQNLYQMVFFYDVEGVRSNHISMKSKQPLESNEELIQNQLKMSASTTERQTSASGAKNSMSVICFKAAPDTEPALRVAQVGTRLGPPLRRATK